MTVLRILVPCAAVLAFGCAVTEANKPAAMSAEPGAELAGTHGAGPSWTLKDGSGAKGDAPNAKRAPSPEAGAIPWLLLPAQSNGQPGELQGVTLVQRVQTHGGIAPASGCTTSTVGAETKVPYTATYVFYR